MTTDHTSQAGERTRVKGKPMTFEPGTMTPCMRDTAGGEKINFGSIIFGSRAGTVKVTDNGVKYEITIIHDSGAGIAFSWGGRSFRFSPQELLDYAISKGFLTPAPVDFEREHEE